MRLLFDADITAFRILWACKDYNFYYKVRANDWVMDRVLDRFSNPEFVVVLSGSNNFRKQISPEYKSNRSVRPPHLYELRNYYQKYWGAVVAEGEADDLIATLHDEDSIIVSSDKDFKQCGGRLYNPWKDELTEVDNPEYWFWFQMIVGDSADVVKTLPGIGPKKAEKILADKGPEEMKVAVMDTYRSFYGDEWFQRFDTTANLLFLRRKDHLNYSSLYL